MTFEELIAGRDAIARTVPVWESVVRTVASWSAVEVVRAVEHRVQRAQRGWSDRDAWNVDMYLSRLAADLLDHLAEHTHGWPGATEQVASFEDWVAVLREQAVALRRPTYDDVGAADWEQLDAARRAALMWIADNINDLWD